MPAERFYYRPPDPGYAALGAGLAQGIQSGVGGYLDERDRRKDRERQERLDQERRENEAYNRSRQELFDEIQLASAGGGMGRAPGREKYDLDFGKVGMARGGPGSVLTQPVQLGPEGPGVVERAAQDPNFGKYRQVGSGQHMAYIEDPEQRNMRLMRQEAMMEDELQDLDRQRLFESLSAARPDMAEGEAMGAAGLLSSGSANYRDLFNTPWQPRTREEYEDIYEFEQKNRRLGGSADRSLPSFENAYEMLKELYGQWDEDGRFLGYSLSNQEMLDLAEAIASGDDYELPEPTGGGGAPQAPAEEERGGDGGFIRTLGDRLQDSAMFFPTGGMNPFTSRRGRGTGQGGNVSELTGGGGATEKQTITQDQADYLMTVQGWTEEQIAERYTIRG